MARPRQFYSGTLKEDYEVSSYLKVHIMDLTQVTVFKMTYLIISASLGNRMVEHMVSHVGY